MTRIHMPSIRSVLEASPFSDRQVAERLDVAESTVSRWRRGESTPAHAYVEELFDVHKSWVRDFNDRLNRMERQCYYLKRAQGLDVERPEGYREAS